MEKPQPYPGAQTVARAVAILKAFSDDRPERGLTDLARAVGLNKTTAYRLLAALEREGMVVRGPSREAYRLGPEAIALGARALRSSDLRAAGHAELETLAKQTGETATLEVLVEDRMLILDEVHGQHLVEAAPSIGTHWPSHATSTGKALLAELSEAERRVAAPSPLAKLTARTLVTQAALRAELDRVRERGYALAVEELEAGFVAVGATVRNHEGRAVAAISVGGPSTRVTRDRLAQLAGLVRQAAARISRRLGHRAADGCR